MVPIDKIRRTIEDLECQRANERTLRRQEPPPQEAFLDTQTNRDTGNPRNKVAKVLAHHIRGTLHDPNREPSEEQRSEIPVIPQIVTTRRNEPLRVPLSKIRSTVTELDHQRWLDRHQRRSEATRQRASRQPTQLVGQLSDSKSICESTASSEPPAIIPPQTISPPNRLSKRQKEPPTTPITPVPPPKKKRRPMYETIQLQRESIRAFLEHLNSCFVQKEEASHTRSWCKEIPLPLQVETAKSFYQAFTDKGTMPVSHCAFCYKQVAPCNLNTIQWKALRIPSLLQATKTTQHCYKYFPSQGESDVAVCSECHDSFIKGKLPKACSVNNIDIGYEHQYPEELDNLTPVEEKLIALQGAFGYITKFAIDRRTRSGINYRKHVKGHIIVFPNKVEDLVATVLPHPLLRTIENIHVSWSGASKPSPADVRYLLQVRKSRVSAALSWLQQNNPLYKHITIDHDEMASWRYTEGSSVPTVIIESMQREEPSAMEKTATDHIVPDTDQGLEDSGFTSIEELLASVASHSRDEPCPSQETTGSLKQRQFPPDTEPSASVLGNPYIGHTSNTIYKKESSAIFPINGPAVFENANKLSFLVNAIHTNRNQNAKQTQKHHRINIHTAGNRPFIRVERGKEFADNLHADFFPRTFPTLFPWGKGGPKALPKLDLDPAQPTHNHSLGY